jgi:hypothetical protein
MLTGQVVQELAALHQAMCCSWMTIWYPSLQNAKWLSPALVSRLNIVPLPMELLKRLSYASCFTSSIAHRPSALLSTVTATTSAMSISPPTPFCINEPSMWRLIFTSSVRRSSLGKFAFSMFRQHHSSPISSRRDSPPRCSMSSVLTFALAML